MTADDVASLYTRERERVGKVPISTKIYQGIGALPDTYKNFAFGTFLLFFYNQVLGMPAVLASAAIMIALVVDAVADPIIGSYSDGLQTRWGRRHPLMYVAALPLGICLLFVFLPPSGMPHVAQFTWLLVFSIGTRISMGFYLVPWNALFAEFSDDYAERSSIVTFRYLWGLIGGLLFAFCTWTFIFPSTPQYTPGHLNPASYRLFATILAGLVTAAALATTVLTHREIPHLLQPRQATVFGLRGALNDVMTALRNRDFLVLFISLLISFALVGTGSALDLYMNTYFWGFLPEDLRWFIVASLGPFIAFASIPALQKRFDKKLLVIGCLFFLLGDGIVVIGLRLLHVLPENGDPWLLRILIANETLRAGVGVVVGIMFASMIADSLDAQELKTGKRQEGVFSAAISFSTKATSGIGVFLGGLLLDYAIRFPRGAAISAVAPSSVLLLGVIAGIVLPLFYVVPFSLISRYDITRAAHAEIQRALHARRNNQQPQQAPDGERDPEARSGNGAER